MLQKQKRIIPWKVVAQILFSPAPDESDQSKSPPLFGMLPRTLLSWSVLLQKILCSNLAKDSSLTTSASNNMNRCFSYSAITSSTVVLVLVRQAYTLSFTVIALALFLSPSFSLSPSLSLSLLHAFSQSYRGLFQQNHNAYLPVVFMLYYFLTLTLLLPLPHTQFPFAILLTHTLTLADTPMLHLNLSHTHSFLNIVANHPPSLHTHTHARHTCTNTHSLFLSQCFLAFPCIR